jgi:hypothetical protein
VIRFPVITSAQDSNNKICGTSSKGEVNSLCFDEIRLLESNERIQIKHNIFTVISSNYLGSHSASLESNKMHTMSQRRDTESELPLFCL